MVLSMFRGLELRGIRKRSIEIKRFVVALQSPILPIAALRPG
jgi:hypothetical protein